MEVKAESEEANSTLQPVPGESASPQHEPNRNVLPPLSDLSETTHPSYLRVVLGRRSGLFSELIEAPHIDKEEDVLCYLRHQRDKTSSRMRHMFGHIGSALMMQRLAVDIVSFVFVSTQQLP